MAISGFLEQSATVTVKIGPFVDDTDGNTDEGGLTIAQADVRLSKNSGNIAQKNNGTSCTHDELGMYNCPLSTTDTNTLGILTLVVHEAGALHVRHDYMVVTTQVYDSLFGTDRLQVHVAEMTNDIITAASIAANAIGSSELAADAITSTILADNAITANKIATDAIGAAEFSQAAADKVFGSGGATLSELSVGIPSATPRPDQLMMLLYMALRNKIDVTDTIKEVHNDAGTIIATKALTDDGTTYSEAEMISG